MNLLKRDVYCGVGVWRDTQTCPMCGFVENVNNRSLTYCTRYHNLSSGMEAEVLEYTSSSSIPHFHLVCGRCRYSWLEEAK